MRYAILTVIVSLAAVPASCADLDITGRWLLRGTENDPGFFVFGADGTLDFEAFAMGLAGTCRYTFDSMGSPAELIVRCRNNATEVETERRVWVVFLAESTVHLRPQDVSDQSGDAGTFWDAILDKVSE